jgi:hypothetical protein
VASGNTQIIGLKAAYEVLQSQEIVFEYGPLVAYAYPEAVQWYCFFLIDETALQIGRKKELGWIEVRQWRLS